jgi:VWFA-related protein
MTSLVPKFRRVAANTFVVLVLCCPVLHGQKAPSSGGAVQSPQTQQTPALTVTTREVVLDVVVTDRKGNLVHRDLAPDDFTIFEDKQPQHIRSFQPPSQHAMPDPGTPVVNSAADLTKIDDAPVTILVLDELNSKFEDMSYARQMLIKYLESQPKVLPDATVLMVASNSTFLQMHDYTQDRDALIEAIKKHMPEIPWRMVQGGGRGPGAIERLALVLTSLQQIAQASSGTPGRKNLIWVGNGFPTVDMVTMPSNQADQINAAIRRCTNRLLAARVTLYTINPTANSNSTVIVDDPSDLDAASSIGPDPFSQGDASFGGVALATGGIAFMGRNDLNNVIGEGISKGADYYTLSYSPTNNALDSAAFRNIRIVMKDPNLRATTREGYYPEAAADLNPVVDRSMTAKQIMANLQLDLSSALTGATAYNGLSISAKRLDDSHWQINIAEQGIDWTASDPNGAQHTEDTIAAAWFSAKNKLLGHVAHEQTCMRATPNAGASYTLTVPLPSSVSRLRLVARDALNGRMGTVDITSF